MNELHNAVAQASIMGLTAREAVVYLKSVGHPDVTETRYAQLKQIVRARGRQRLAEIGKSGEQYHADSIVSIETIRAELWRNYHSIQGPPPPPKDDGEDDLTPAARAAWQRAAVESRRRILGDLAKLEPFLTAYVESAEIRIAGGAGGAFAPGSAHHILRAEATPIDPGAPPKIVVDPDDPTRVTAVPADDQAGMNGAGGAGRAAPRRPGRGA